jgi:hypothetical protein
LSDGTIGQFISTDGAANLSFSSAVTSITAGSNLTGGTITTTGTIALSATPSGLTSIGVGNITISGNTINSSTSTPLSLVSTGDMTFTPSANASFISNIIVRSGNYIQLNNTGNTFSVALKAGAVSSNTTWTLPLTDGSSGQFISTNGSAALSFSSAVTSITAGSNLTGGTITTTGTIALSSTPSGLTSIDVGSLTLSSTNVSSSAALVLKTNGSTTALTLSTAQKATFSAGIETAPAVSGTPTLSLGSAYQNTLGYDVILSLYLNITVNSTGSISCGVGPTNSPSTQTILSGVTVLGYFPITVYLPSNYYVIVNTSGITASIVGQQVTAV